MSTDDFFWRAWEMLIGRAAGPMTFRLIVQPTIATFLAIRAGIKDAREGHEPFLWSGLTDAERRPHLLAQARKDVGKVFILAVVLDVVYELIELKWVYPLQAVIVATVLAIVPYVLIRGPVTRLVRRLRKP